MLVQGFRTRADRFLERYVGEYAGDINFKQITNRFGISSLFTNVPLRETIGTCAEALYKYPSFAPPIIPQAVFIELLESAALYEEFSFNYTTYKQADRVAMGSSLGPELANIFVGYYESKPFLVSKR